LYPYIRVLIAIIKVITCPLHTKLHPAFFRKVNADDIIGDVDFKKSHHSIRRQVLYKILGAFGIIIKLVP
jgi:hypothetical protein